MIMLHRRRNSFSDNLIFLLEELKLAIQWHSPSILLAICNSRFVRVRAKNELKDKLKELGFSVINIDIDSHSPSISHQIMNRSKEQNVVFFISNIDWGSGKDRKDAYRNLNLNREIFIENQIKTVIWLTKTESMSLPVYAPDLWAFRHYVVEFSTVRSGRKSMLPAEILIWHHQGINEPVKILRDRIETNERYLKQLPQTAEANSSRIELLYTIGHLYWCLGDSQKATELLQLGIDTDRQPEHSLCRTWLLNGLAIIHYEKGEYLKAAEIYIDLITNNQNDGILRIDLGITLCALGKYSKAISECKKAVKLNTTNANIWNRIGYIYLAAGKMDEATSAFKKAIQLAPTSSAFYESLAIDYYMLGLTEESFDQIEIANKYAGNETFFLKVYEEVIQGNSEKSIERIQSALISGLISKTDLKRNYNSRILLQSLLEEKSLKEWHSA